MKKMLERFIIDKTGYETIVFCEKSHYLSFEAELALKILIDKALITADSDGEDSSGRSKLKYLGDEKTVKRAFSLANLACKEIEERNLLIEATVKEKDKRELA